VAAFEGGGDTPEMFEHVHEHLDTLLPLMMETEVVSEIFELYSQIMQLYYSNQTWKLRIVFVQ